MLGLTGGIAGGKSTVSKRLAELGAFIIDADLVSREVIESPAVLGELRRAFGEGIFGEDGRLIRRALAAEAFKTQQSAELLNRIMHPAIMSEIKSRRAYAEALGCYPLIVIDAALLIESGFHTECSGVWLIACDEETRIKRAAERDGVTLEEARQRVKRQMSDEQKALFATRVIHNDGTVEELMRKVDEAFAQEVGGIGQGV